MRRWMAWLLAATLIIGGIPIFNASGEDDAGTLDIVAIQEGMISEEGDQYRGDALADNLRLVAELLQSEEVNDLLQIQDVREVAAELMTNVGRWLWENPEVTLKILMELGFTQDQMDMVQRLWKIAEDLAAEERVYYESEDGQLLQQEFDTLKANPAYMQVIEDLEELISSADLRTVVTSLIEAVKEKESIDYWNEEIVKKFTERDLETEDEVSALLVEVLSVVAHSEWSKESMPELLNQDDFWIVIEHLQNSREERVMVQLRKTIREVTADEELMAFLSEACEQIMPIVEVLKEYEKETAAQQIAGEEGPQ